MGKTKRNVSRWMETRFKYGDPSFPKWNEDFFDSRYQNKIRNKNHSYHTEKIDPLSYKVASWREYGNWAKPLAKRAARHNAKLMIIKLAHTIMDEIWQDEQKLMWEDDDWYDDHPMSFDFSYSDEAYEYAEQRRLEEIQYDYEQREWGSTYDPYEDWDY